MLKDLLSNIHTPMDGSESNLTLVACPTIFGMETGAEARELCD